VKYAGGGKLAERVDSGSFTRFYRRFCMFDIISLYRSDNICFAGIKPKEDHNVYLSAYGTLVSTLLERYAEDKRADNEELFAEWDESVQKASSQAGFTATHETEDGYVYISSFQNGIGMSGERRVEQGMGNARREHYEADYGE
jgi:plastocyanin